MYDPIADTEGMPARERFQWVLIAMRSRPWKERGDTGKEFVATYSNHAVYQIAKLACTGRITWRDDEGE